MVVYGLLRWRAPAVLILVCLLVQWQGQLNHTIEPCLLWRLVLSIYVHEICLVL